MFKVLAALAVLAGPLAAQARRPGAVAANDSVSVAVDLYTAKGSTAFKSTTGPRVAISLMDGYSVRDLPPFPAPLTPGGKASITANVSAKLDTVIAVRVDFDPAGATGGDWILDHIVIRRAKFPSVNCGAKEKEADRRFNALGARAFVC